MTEPTSKSRFKDLPSVNDILRHPRAAQLIEDFGREAVKYAARQTVAVFRQGIQHGAAVPALDGVVTKVARLTEALHLGTLKPVVNATGVILHTNLSRAPLGQDVIAEISAIAAGYSNLEYNLERAGRGNRHAHVRKMLQFLTTAEDVVVVNNNAGALVLILNCLAQDKDVLISRGELIEIGGSFRIPEIMAASGARMVEVGTTNRTRLSDYEAGIGPDTALIFKAHKSNFSMQGFVEEASIKALADLAHQHDIPMLYDLGSGLLRKPAGLPLGDEPDVKQCLEAGADLVCFSGDKLLGGPQAGIIAGNGKLIKRLAKAPLMRALRVCKLTYAALTAVCRQYFKDETLRTANPTYAMLERSPDTLDALAEELLDALATHQVNARKVKSQGQCGGGTLPDLKIPSAAVEVLPIPGMGTPKVTFAEFVFAELLTLDRPVLSILREGNLLLDVLTLFNEDIPYVAQAIATIIARGGSR
ncbi:MAG: L-seryl-tRNA(Sec) selenium transferase [Myxococcota bacterium]|nr:L-seryl-tRNA(Sec) selenium transferase [Myxococcota bacterium]